MSNKKGLFLLVIGLLLVGIGSYFGFEKYGEYLKNKNNQQLYTGIYKSEENTISVMDVTDEKIKISIDDTVYILDYNGQYYENKENNYQLKIDNKSLTLLKNNEESEEFYKEK